MQRKNSSNRTRRAASPAGGSHRRAAFPRDKHAERWSRVVLMISNAGKKPAESR